jgi:hypothetical protein
LSGITGGFFLALAYFGTDQSSGTLFIWEIGSRKPNGTHHERIIKSADAVLYFIDWCYGICFFQFNPVPLNFNPNNKAMIEKSALRANTMLWRKIRRFIRR